MLNQIFNKLASEVGYLSELQNKTNALNYLQVDNNQQTIQSIRVDCVQLKTNQQKVLAKLQYPTVEAATAAAITKDEEKSKHKLFGILLFCANI